jgi:hypothetical protein
MAFVVVLAILLLGAAPASAASRAPSRQIAPDADVLQRFEGSWNRGMTAYDRFLHAAAPDQHLLSPLPDGSGEGRRIVYSGEDQMVWLVAEDGTVLANYLVSGRKEMPKPGTYSVFSKSPVTRAFLDPNSIMRWMVRFARTDKTNIGFHDIPVHGDGSPYQTVDELGTALSGGCIRQELGAAKRLYRFADVGTPVVVTS